MRLLFECIGGAVVILLLLLIIPQRLWCFLGWHVPTGYGVRDKLSTEKGMWTKCKYCKKEFLVHKSWMDIKFGSCKNG